MTAAQTGNASIRTAQHGHGISRAIDDPCSISGEVPLPGRLDARSSSRQAVASQNPSWKCSPLYRTRKHRFASLFPELDDKRVAKRQA